MKKAVRLRSASANDPARKGGALVIVSNDDLSIIGGSHILIRDEFRYFDRRLPTVLLSRKPIHPMILEGTSYHFVQPAVPTRYLRLLTSMMATFHDLVGLSRRAHPAVFHANDALAAFSCCLFGRILNVPTVLTVHGPLTYEFVSFYGAARERFDFADFVYFHLISGIERYAYKHVDAIIAVSEFERKFIEKTRHENVHVIMNGIDLNVFRPDAKGLEALHELTQVLKGKKVVIFVGRMVPKNGILVLAKAIPKVVLARDDVVFLIVGDGFGRKEFEAIVSRPNVSSRVIMVGEKTDPAPYYKISDLFVSHVSSLMEGVGLTVLEAISCGVPILVGKDPVSTGRLKTVAHFVRKDDPIALSKRILSLLDQDLSSERAKLRRFAERTLGLAVTFQRYLEVFKSCRRK